jgi:Mn-containing catalase
MYYFDKPFSIPFVSTSPPPFFARQLQQAIGGVEGKSGFACSIFSRHGAPEGPQSTRTYCLILRQKTAPASMKESAADSNAVVNAVMGGGERPRHILEGIDRDVCTPVRL